MIRARTGLPEYIAFSSLPSRFREEVWGRETRVQVGNTEKARLMYFHQKVMECQSDLLGAAVQEYHG